jgi:hypothetical protein
MAGDVDLRHAFSRDAVDVCERIKIMIARRNVDIVYIQENSAIGPFDDFVQKLEGSRLEALTVALVPANSPANAAPAKMALVVFVMSILSSIWNVNALRTSVPLEHRHSCGARQTKLVSAVWKRHSGS